MLLTAITFFLILSVLVLIHELGHFTVARFFGVRVDEFGFGLPPRIWGKKFGKTLYSLNMLPIGGFVKLAGEDQNEMEEQKAKEFSKEKKQEFFWAKSRKIRAAILLAGVTMNFLLAIFLTTILLTRGIIEETKVVRVDKVTAGSPAIEAGMQVGDRVVTIGSSSISDIIVEKPDTLITFVKAHAGETVTMILERNGQQLRIQVVPRVSPPEGEGPLGVAITNIEKKKYPLSQAPKKAVEITVKRAWQMISSLAGVVEKLVTGKSLEKGEISGPIGIAQVTGEAVKYGLDAVLEFMAILSLNLAILNVLPFPALDGGRLMFVIAEKFGKKARPAVERTIHQIGMLFLLALILIVTVNDILRIVRG